MLKIFQTGDNHIGLKYASHPAAAELCKKRITAFEDMVECANRECCNLFVITGDLFENINQISKGDIKELLKILSKFQGIVVVLPGNHDYYDKNVKVWNDFEEMSSSYDNIMLLNKYKPYPVNTGDTDVILYPAHCTSLHSAPGENNLKWIKDEKIIRDHTYRLGIAHGAVDGETIDSEGKYFLMKRSELESIPVDAWLIGHTHVPFPRDLKEDEYMAVGKVFNAGTHVQTDVSCNTDGECFIIKIDENKHLKAKKFVSGNLRFYRKNINLSPGEMEEKLHRELQDFEDNSVVDLILDGVLTEEEYKERHKVLEDSLSRFIEGTYNDRNLSPLITKEAIEAEFPETSFSAGLLKALLDEPKEVQLAYELINTLKGGETK